GSEALRVGGGCGTVAVVVPRDDGGSRAVRDDHGSVLEAARRADRNAARSPLEHAIAVDALTVDVRLVSEALFPDHDRPTRHVRRDCRVDLVHLDGGAEQGSVRRPPADAAAIDAPSIEVRETAPVV